MVVDDDSVVVMMAFERMEALEPVARDGLAVAVYVVDFDDN